MELKQFFSGLKVVELAGVLAGPAVGMFFAELGAEVIKVENKSTGGDVTRRWKLPAELPEAPVSAYYASVNFGKRVLMLDLAEPADRQEVHELIRRADVVLCNFRPGSAEKLEMDYPTLQRLNPLLIYGQVNGFGAGSRRPAFDVVLQAEAGFLYMTGAKDGPPAKMPVALIDILAAHQLKEGILLALMRRAQTGQGALVSTSLLETAIASLANQAANWLVAGHIPRRMGAQHPNIAPYGDIFVTKDAKPIVLAAGTEQQFRRLCTVLGCPELADDERFQSNAGRVRRREALQLALQPGIGNRMRDELLTSLEAEGVPAGAIREMPEVFELPQAREMLLEYQPEPGRSCHVPATVAFRIKE